MSEIFVADQQIEALKAMRNGEWYWGLSRVTGHALVKRGWAEYKRASVHMWRITPLGFSQLASIEQEDEWNKSKSALQSP